MRKILAACLSTLLCLNAFSLAPLAEETETPEDTRNLEPSSEETPDTEEQPEKSENETDPETEPVLSEENSEEEPEASETETAEEEAVLDEDPGMEVEETAMTVMVTFVSNAEGVEGEMEPQLFAVDEKENLQANAFTLEGYDFVAWNTEASGTGIFYLDGQLVSFTEENEEITLYAQWAETTVSLALEEGDEYSYHIDEDGFAVIDQYVGSEKHVVIPSEIDGHPVAKINAGAFRDNTVIEEISVSDGVLEIDQEAFSGCLNLKKAEISDSVTVLGSGAFKECKALESIVLSASLTEISPNLFQNCQSLEEITIPDGVTLIGQSAFAGCKTLGSVWVPEGVTEIRDCAFSGCASLFHIELPSSLEVLKSQAFQGCSSIMKITLPQNIRTVESYTFDGCRSLYEFNGPGVTEIEAFAFGNCQGLREMNTPNLSSFDDTTFGLFVINRVEKLDLRNAESIDFGLMKSFIKLKEITLGPSLKTIDTAAFSLVPGGLSVFFTGTQQEWKCIDVKPLNPVIKNAEVTYLIPVSGIVLEETEITVAAGETYVLNAHVLPEDASNPDIRWTSSDADVADVDLDGWVTGISKGTAVITAVTEDGDFTASCVVSVIPHQLYITGLEDSYPYTGKAIRPTVQVYDGTTLLSEKTDYTISYQNNIRAAESTDARAPSVIVKGKGKYTSRKTVSFTIAPVSMAETSVQEMTMIQSASPRKLKPDVKVTWNGMKLKSSDYQIDYNGWDQMEAGDHEILLCGKGNFTGTVKAVVHVLPDGTERIPVTKLRITSKAVAYSPDLSLRKILVESGFTVKDGKTVLNEDEDYVLSDEKGCSDAGTCTFVLSGKAVYEGTRTISIPVRGTSLANVRTSGSAVYDGYAKTLEDGITVQNGKTVLVRDRDYEVQASSYENNINAGKAYVTIRGRGGYTGVKRISFVIEPDRGEKTVTVSEAIYTKNGAVPEVTVTAGEKILREGSDYRTVLSDNKKIGNGKLTVIYLGNYKGTRDYTTSFQIDPKPIYAVTAFAQDPVWSNKKGNYIPKLTLIDDNGKNLKAGTDYEKDVVYYDENDMVLDRKAVLAKGAKVRAVIRGKGNYSDETEVSFTLIEKTQSIANAVIRIRNQEYTGNWISVNPEDITSASVKINRQTVPLEYGRDYVLYSLTNHLNQGTAKAVFIGTGDYVGYKTVTFRITRRSVDKNWIDQLFDALGW